MEATRIWNPPNPYLTEHRELLGESQPVDLEVYEDTSQSILSHNDSPDISFRWSVNPYRGCFHACLYCMSGGTPIAMTDGRIKPLADIRVGDEVYGAVLRGRYRYFVKTHVLAHWSVIKPAYRITLEDGTQLITSADHRFLTQRGWKHVIGAEQGRTVRPHLTLANELLGTGQFETPPEKDDEYQRGYLCGMIRGDGLLGTYNYDGRRRASDTLHQFRLALIDLEALRRSQQYLSAFEIQTREFLFQKAAVGYQPVYAIRTSARLQVEGVRQLVQWPMNASVNWRKGFLAGIFDAEGSYSYGILRISNTDVTIIQCVTDSLHQFGFDCVVEKQQRAKPVYTVRLQGGLVEHLRFLHSVDPAITRKMNIEGQAIKNRARLRVASIENLGLSLPMFDMTTGTGNFIANGVVSHNCYARPTHEYFGLGAGSDFERKIFVKRNAPELLEKAFRRKSWMGERVVFSGVTDCYQPLEAAWKLTRGCLEVCLNFRNPAAIITKSILIRRDIDLLKQLAQEASVTVSISIPFLDEEVARAVEPGAPTIARRFETIALLAEAGVPVGIGVAPIIPGLNDRDIPGLLREAKRYGAKFAFRTLLRLPGSVREVFFHRMREKFPDRAGHIESLIRGVRGGRLYDSRFGHRHEGTGPYWEAIDQAWELWTRRFGFNDDLPERPSAFRRPPEAGSQLEFHWQ
ncbi:MAG: radical SAM protein [Candidatus Omnitrophica bacterium]|nr:radical SAM protein [Candidatus Omnitrophota bacterium]